MRSDDIIAKRPEIAHSNMIEVCNSFAPEIQKHSLNSFDISSYSKILQQVAKFCPYEHTAMTTSLSLSNPSGSSFPLPILEASSHFQQICNFPTALLSKDNYMALGYEAHIKKEDMSVDEITTSNGEIALDLSTQREDSNMSTYRRITLEQVKHKVVEDVWVENDRKLIWKDSKIAAFNPAQKLFMCLDCEHIGFLSRVAEHWLGSHANLRVFHCPRCPYTSAWSRCVKMHLTRHHSEQSADTTMWKGNPLLIEVTGLMQELRTKVETKIDANNLIADKRFYCPHCPYATDRRDLYTRHENIHKDDKPFHCYVCFKQFNRADHVKKHFVRMHADSQYDLTKIRKSLLSSKVSAPINNCDESKNVLTSVCSLSKASLSNLQNRNSICNETRLGIKESAHLVQSETSKTASLGGTESASFNLVPSNIEVGDSNSIKARKKTEKAFTCHYCNWSGSDNWCLKRHMNTHIKPFACVLCDYKAARAERLSTHVFKVHNKKICNKCSFLADTQAALLEHTREEHHNNPYSRRHICSSCGMSFDTKANLETHIHLCHTRPPSPNDIVEITPIPIPEGYQGSDQELAFKENIGSFVYPENSLRKWSSNYSTRDMNQTHSKDAILASCPHCEYKLSQNQESKDHWLEHHQDVCGACVHVFTSVYGPQVWKKVVVHPECADQCDETISLANKYLTDNQSTRGSHSLLLQNCSLPPEEITDRSLKRPRKQSYPKKVITYQSDDSIVLQRKKQKQSRLIFRCKLCPRKPRFQSIAQYKLHKLKRHSKRLKQLKYRMKRKN